MAELTEEFLKDRLNSDKLTADKSDEIATPTSDHFSTPEDDNSVSNGDLEKEYDFGSHRDSDEGSWETVSEEMRASDLLNLEHSEDGPCECDACCNLKSRSFAKRIQARKVFESDPLPENVTKVVTNDGAQIYVVGTAHFSKASQDDVERVIKCLSPDVVMVELCHSRVGVLTYDEDSLLKAAQDVSVAKLKQAIKESGSVISGVMQLLLLSMSAHITKQLGMAPGGEFRVAAKQARNIPDCILVLGDRPIQSTLGRAMASLSVWQKLKLGWHLLFSKDSITKEDVEKYKQKDMIAEMLAEMTGDFPQLSKVFVQERDQYMAQMLAHCANMVRRDLPPVIYVNHDQPVDICDRNKVDLNEGNDLLENEERDIALKSEEGRVAKDEVVDEEDIQKREEISRVDYQPVIVAVIGIGHMNGIIENIDKQIDMNELNKVPPPSYSSKVFKMAIKAAVVAAISWGVYSVISWVRS